MSEQDQTEATGQARAREEDSRAQNERSDRSGRREGGGGRRGGRRSGRHGGGSSSSGQRLDPALNMEELRELADLFTTHGLTDFEFENAEIRVRLSRNVVAQSQASNSPASASAPIQAAAPPQQQQSVAQNLPQQQSLPPTATHPTTAASPSNIPAQTDESAEDLHIITSPIVGTFYRSSSPTAESFVKVGSRVEADTVVCIIEAMKLMNEIQAETTGSIEKIYVENGQPVEYGQPLFGVKK